MISQIRALALSLVNTRTIWAVVDQVVVSGASFVTMIVLARQLGLSEFGHFSIYWTTVLFVSAMQTALVIFPMQSLHAHHRGAGQHSYYSAVFVIQTIICSGASVATLLVLLLLHVAFPTIVDAGIALPLSVCLFFVLFHDYLRRSVFLEGRYFAVAASDIVRYVLQIFALLALSTATSPAVATTFWILAGCALVGSLICMVVAPRPVFDWVATGGVAARHWHSSKWLFTSSLLSWLSANSLTFLVGAFAGTAAVGGMRASQNLAGVMNIPLQGLQNVVPAEASAALASHQRAGLRSYLGRVGGGLLLVGIVVTAVVAVAPDWWLSLVYGDEFAGFGYLLVCYGLIFAAAALELPLSAGLRALESTRPVFVAYAVGTAFTIGAGVLLVPAFGVFGAVLVILASWILRNLIILRSLSILLDTRNGTPLVGG
jgi:O-antigen/teichoic acid export membrane protein